MAYSRERGQAEAVSQAVVLKRSCGEIKDFTPTTRRSKIPERFANNSHSILNALLRKWKKIALELISGKHLMLR